MLFAALSCNNEESKKAQAAEEAKTFLEAYNTEFQKLYYASAEAEWAANTQIVLGDTLNAVAVQKANEAME